MSRQKLSSCGSVKWRLWFVFPISCVSPLYNKALCFAGCANSFTGVATPSDFGCILPCFGNSSELCGDEYYFNGYNNTAFNQVSTATSPITVPGYGYWESIGCYRLETSRYSFCLCLTYLSSGGAGALSPDIDVTDAVGGAMTVEKCVGTCAAGLPLAGILNGNTCCMYSVLTVSNIG